MQSCIFVIRYCIFDGNLLNIYKGLLSQTNIRISPLKIVQMGGILKSLFLGIRIKIRDIHNSCS